MRSGPPAWELGEMLTTHGHRKITILQNIHSCLGLILGYNLKMENGHEIQHLECEVHVNVGSLTAVARELVRYKLDSVDV
jgi:hypothetical protein